MLESQVSACGSGLGVTAFWLTAFCSDRIGTELT